MAENMPTFEQCLGGVRGCLRRGTRKRAGVTRFEETSFIAQPDISIDYAVMEKAERIAMVPAGFGWSDVGSWDAVAGAHEADADGNSAMGADECSLSKHEIPILKA